MITRSRQPLFLLILLLFVILPGVLRAQSWQFAKERDGIKVYTRTDENSSLKSFKGVMEVHSTMDKVTSLIGNVKNFDWWDDDIREIKVLGFEKDKFFKYYLIYDVPWPFFDRDLCVETLVTIDPKTGRRTYMARPLPNVIPENPDMVRIKNYWQKWTIIPMEKGVIKLVLEGFVDPGGTVPAWLYNMVITDTPLKVMREVQKRVE